MEENRVKGKIAFISGASSGIGKATAEKLAQMGVNLILCARRENILNELKDLNDDIPEDMFRNVGPIEDVIKKAKAAGFVGGN